ncbi:PLP-dependent aminotransferase family protein [Nonomuraea sp. NPDC050556]|uniref:MocR-like pyridoxine biosynthesis transcription factor PdxR n=1 Tax=Nonomuraea sp. NPDC050556 TaxID=3364369 RepID=UPI00378E9E1E
MDLHISLADRDLAGQIYRQIRAAILDGRLRPGQALPSSRELHRRLEVSRNTVATAYERLTGEGFLVTRAGAGTYVSAAVGESAGERRPTGRALRPRPQWEQEPEPPDLSAHGARFDLRPGIVDARLFPYQTWRRVVAAELRPSAVGTAAHGDPMGLPELRAAIARHVGVARGVRTDADHVVVTTGIQQALDLVTRVLVGPGDVVAIEEPGYHMARRLFASLGAQVVPVPVDAHGLVVSALPRTARMVYVTPSHQSPLGLAMSLTRRMELLAFAQETGAAVIEDDYDSEFRYTGRPIEALHSLDQAGLVLYLSSFSKIMLPTLRMGFLIVPPSLRRAVRAAKHLADWHTALPNQGALARFIEEGALARHVRTARREYQVRRDLVLSALDGPLAPWLEPIPAVAGLHISAYARRGSREDLLAVAERARERDVAVWTMAAHAATPGPRPGLMLGFGAIRTDQVEEALDRLSCVIRAWLPEG